MNMHKPNEHKHRLQWKCRRGTLELDYLLSHYMNQGYSKAKAEEMKAFEELLNKSDHELFDWLVLKQGQIPKKLARIVQIILTSTQAHTKTHLFSAEKKPISLNNKSL
jgi:antitoxin CptB